MSYFKLGAIALSLFTVTAFVWASESDEIQEKARAMQREAAELAERGHGKEAENLERKAAAMLEEAERLNRRHPDRRDAEIREMHERLEMLRLEERELEEIGGKEERLGDVRREAERTERELHQHSHDGPHGERGPQDEIARRSEHMRAAVEHLHHAGLHEIAERAEAAERELREHNRQHEIDPMHEVLKQLDEIRHEVGRLRDEVNELREKR